MADKEVTILLIDDSDEILVPLQFLLHKEGIKTDVAHNGIEALELLKARQYSLILLDFHMPGMNGDDFLRHKAELKNDTPVVVISGETRAQLEESGVGLRRFLPKPFRFRDVVDVVREIILTAN